MIMALTLGSCGSKKENAAALEEKPQISGIMMNNLDTAISPAEDFYGYACGGWMKNNPLPAEYARYGSFDQLGENTDRQLNKLITDIAQQNNEPGSIAQKIGDLYNLGMDTVTLNEQAARPIEPMLRSIAAVKSKKELTALLVQLHQNGITPFFAIFGEASPNNSTQNIAWLMQSGIGLGERDYYLTPSDKIKNGYIALIQKELSLANYGKIFDNPSKEADVAKQIWNFETALAKIFIDKNDLRDPVKNNNVISLEAASNLIPTIDIAQYMSLMVPNPIQEVNMVQPAYFTALNKLLQKQDLATLKAYMAWQVINESANYLSDDFSEAHFAFYGKVISGQEKNKERWKRVVNTVSGLLSEPVGQLYVQQYFPAEAKDRMLHLVNNLKSALGDRIMSNTWMSQETKVKAKEKLEAMIVKIGYPDTWRDYDSLEVVRDSYYANILRATRFEHSYEMSKIGKPVNPMEWHMSPQTVNAYYNPSTNEICFPAGILQPPFFDMHADDAVNYGAIGVVIGHEMTHGFDDQGRQYDKLGNVKDWWLEQDSKNFAERAQVLVDYFSNIEVLPGLKADGKYTLGENIADNGGVNTSFAALQRAKAEGSIADALDGFTADQRFFLAYAAVWANNIRDEEIERRTKIDPHSLGKWRVNGTLPHIDAFIKAFNIQEGDPMYLAPEQRVDIW